MSYWKSVFQHFVTCNEALQNIHPFEGGSGQARLLFLIHALKLTFGLTSFFWTMVYSELGAFLMAHLHFK